MKTNKQKPKPKTRKQQKTTNCDKVICISVLLLHFSLCFPVLFQGKCRFGIPESREEQQETIQNILVQFI